MNLVWNFNDVISCSIILFPLSHQEIVICIK
jgi:hypothetical protein